MKIVYLTDNVDHKNGGGRFSSELIRQMKLAMPEIEQIVVVKSAADPTADQMVIGRGMWGFFRNFFRLRAMVREADYIHAFDGMPYGLMAALVAFGLPTKIIITFVGSGSIQPLQSPVGRSLLSWVYRRAHKVIAISSYTASEVLKRLPGLAIEVIVPGINGAYFEALRQELSADSPVTAGLKPYILTVGKLKPRKGYLQSLAVFARLHQIMPDLHYVIVGQGDGAYRQAMLDYIDQHNLASAVTVLQHIEDRDLAQLYAQAELFLLLPQNIDFDIEGFGLVYVEAACFGLPVIGSDHSGAVDALRHEFNGYLVDPTDTEEAVSRAVAILRDPILRQQLSQHSLEFSHELDWQQIRQRYVEVYTALAS
jgi:glycosyltransferase involved in cell wall biosynthesis